MIFGTVCLGYAAERNLDKQRYERNTPRHVTFTRDGKLDAIIELPEVMGQAGVNLAGLVLEMHERHHQPQVARWCDHECCRVADQALRGNKPWTQPSSGLW